MTTDPGEPRRNDEDEAWADIVARWQREDDSPVPPWPVTEDVDPGRRDPDADAPEPQGGWARRVTDEPPEDVDLGDEPPAGSDPALEEHFVPPPPPPLPKPQKHTAIALVGIVLGLVLLLAPGLLTLDRSNEVGFLGVALLVAGVVTLVWKMRDAPPTDSGPDDGAVV